MLPFGNMTKVRPVFELNKLFRIYLSTLFVGSVSFFVEREKSREERSKWLN